MNYQPFLDMNILLSDDFLQSIYNVRFALYGLVFSTMLIGYISFSLIEHLTRYLLRDKKRPYMEFS